MAAPSTPIAVASTGKRDVFPLGADVWGVQKVTLTRWTIGAKYYSSSGIPLTAKQLGLTDVRWVVIHPEVPLTGAAGTRVFRYDYTNKLIRVYEQSDLDNAVALAEVADSDTAFTPFIVRIQAYGL